MWIIECLSCKCVNSRCHINLTCCKKSWEIETESCFTFWEQEINIWLVKYFWKYLECWIDFLYCLIDENTLSVNHFIIHLRWSFSINCRIMSHNYSFVSFMNECLSQYFIRQWGAFYEENPWKFVNTFPDIPFNNWWNYDNILLITFKILSSQRKNEMIDRRMKTTNYNMIWQLKI